MLAVKNSTKRLLAAALGANSAGNATPGLRARSSDRWALILDGSVFSPLIFASLGRRQSRSCIHPRLGRLRQWLCAPPLTRAAGNSIEPLPQRSQARELPSGRVCRESI